MKKLIVALGIVAISMGAFARPGFHHYHPHPHVYHHHHHSYWGHGGHGFWPGFVGGVVGGAIVSSVVDTRPVVVTQPTVVAAPAPVVVQQVQQVWVEGQYVDQVQANGSTVRVWNPGHYEQRTVIQ